jgi:hypothetical protein
MAERSYLSANLREWATFKSPEWGSFLLCEVEELEKTKEKYNKELKVTDRLKAENEELKAYVVVLERQLSIVSKILEMTRKVKFPIYTERRRCKNATELYGKPRRTHERDDSGVRE